MTGGMHGGSSRSVDRDLAQEVEVIQHLPRAQDDRGLRVVRHRDGEAGLLAEALVEVLELRAAAGQDDSLVHDVRGQLRGVCSKATRTASMMLETVSESASRISSSEITSVLGMPYTRSRPLISIVSSSSSGNADPMLILISSAVRSPTRRLYLRLMYWMMSWSMRCPAMRTDLE